MELITKKELLDFEKRLFKKINELILYKSEMKDEDEYIDKNETLKLLNCRDSTLSSLRKNKELVCMKIGKEYSYQLVSVKKIMKKVQKNV